ncbi:hypothetical protein ACFQY5_36790 [Paeniroseomonas aquatica]|uniref:hypothetical protein n=1 Tax=Paeniroseomonas aquatica TaxID=373043 RepID=UPI0036080B30
MAQTGGDQGSGLVGTLESPALITDPTRFPQQFQEAPMLAEQVRAGRLPPVAQRLPQDLMVIQPLRGVGKYGGTWRRGFIGPGDSENGNRLMSADKPLFFDETGTKSFPASPAASRSARMAAAPPCTCAAGCAGPTVRPAPPMTGSSGSRRSTPTRT